MTNPDFDFRACPGKKETRKETRRRVMFERLNADSFLKYRMETIADVYSVPLRKMHYDSVIRKAIPNVDQLRKEIKKDYMAVSTVHILKLGDSGEVNARSTVLGQKIPDNFYRSTKLAGWKVYRFHHINQEKTTTRGPEVMDNSNLQVSYCDFKHIVEAEIAKAVSKEREINPLMKRSSKGSFFVIKDYETRVPRRGSMGGEFSGTLGKQGYEKFDKNKAERRASMEARKASIPHVVFSGLESNYISESSEPVTDTGSEGGHYAGSESEPSRASESAHLETARSETGASEAATTVTAHSEPTTETEEEE